MNKYKTIGILGGMGAEATVDLYMGIWKYFQKNFGAKYDNDFPRVIIYSVPIPDVVENLENEQLTLKMLKETAKVLEAGGCDYIVIACNTVQFLLKEIRSAVRVPIIGIAETVAKHLSNKGIKSVGILSTRATIEKKVYDKEMAKIGIELIKPDTQNQEIVTRVIMSQLAGKRTIKETNDLIKVSENLVKQGAQEIILACTDLPLVLNQKDISIPIIDNTQIYAYETARLAKQ